MVVVYTQANKKARKKERKKRSWTCLDSVSLFAMHGMTQPKLLLLLLFRRRRRLRDGGGGVASRSRNQATKQIHLLYSFILLRIFFGLLLLLQESTEILPATAKILNCFAGGIVATKHALHGIFLCDVYANDAPRRASRWDPTHLSHILCFILLTGVYKLFGNR